MNKILLNIYLVFAFLFASNPVLLAQTEVIKFDQLDFPPKSIQNEKGEFVGVVFEVIHSTLDKMGVQYKTTMTPMKRIVAGLEQGTTNLTALLNSPSLQPHTWALEPPFTYIRIVEYHKGNKPEIKSKQDMNGKSFIVLRGWTYLDWIKHFTDPANKVKLEYADSHEIAFKMLDKGRADYLLEYSEPAEETLKTLKIDDLHSHLVQEVSVHVLISKKQPQAEEFKAKFEKAYLEVLKEKGIH